MFCCSTTTTSPLANESIHTPPYPFVYLSKDEAMKSSSGSEIEHVPLNAREARHTLAGSLVSHAKSSKPKEQSVDEKAKQGRREKAKAAKLAAKSAGGASGKGGGKIPKGKRRVMKEREFVNEKGRTGAYLSSFSNVSPSVYFVA